MFSAINSKIWRLYARWVRRRSAQLGFRGLVEDVPRWSFQSSRTYVNREKHGRCSPNKCHQIVCNENTTIEHYCKQNEKLLLIFVYKTKRHKAKSILAEKSYKISVQTQKQVTCTGEKFERKIFWESIKVSLNLFFLVRKMMFSLKIQYILQQAQVFFFSSLRLSKIDPRTLKKA